MPNDLRQECELLAEHDDASRGIRVHLLESGDYALTWVNRRLGTVNGSYVRTGEVPE